jgi:DNA sulfur modification protein DndE
MFTSIKTSKANKDLVSDLTRRLNLGAENTIARIAFAHSIATDGKLDLKKILDSGGKEYSVKVLFGEYTHIYVGLVCVTYKLHKSDKDIPRYIKMHIDEGLESIRKHISSKNSITGMEFITNEIEKGIKQLG